MNEKLLTWLNEIIAKDRADEFYRSYVWKKKSAEVRALDRNECQLCKDRGRYAKAQLVHHVNHLKDKPELALDIYYFDAEGKRQRNLLSVCRKCHETVCHPEKELPLKSTEKFTTPERWD